MAAGVLLLGLRDCFRTGSEIKLLNQDIVNFVCFAFLLIEEKNGGEEWGFGGISKGFWFSELVKDRID